METLLRLAKKVIPKSLFEALQPLYHFLLSYVGAFLYKFPSNELYVIGVTGTKGKSSVVEIVNAVLEGAGHKTAILSTIRFKVGKDSEKNLFKMTMPGRLFVQRFIRKAVNKGCTHLVIEMTSEGAKQYRHKNIALDALVFTNLSPEHIESHGSFENYKNAKLKLRDALSSSKKKETTIVVNNDDEHAKDFLDTEVAHKLLFSLSDVSVNSTYPTISFSRKNVSYTSPLQGEFNVYNLLAGITLAEHLGISNEKIQKTVSVFKDIPGRVQYVDEGQSFKVVVDYAHTPDSLEKFYKNFEGQRTVCILGNTGGGRDTWKRPAMGKLAEKYCDEIILTDEDPYDEDPKKIVEEMVAGMERKPDIIMDRKEAMKTAFKSATPDSIVLITGKGTDPYIMRANGAKEVWSDADVARAELKKLTKT